MSSLEFGSDLATRYRYFSRESLAHPAKGHCGLWQWLIRTYTAPGQAVIDPMAGIGTTALAALEQRDVVLLDVESRWIAEAHRNAAAIVAAAGLFAGRIDIRRHDARQPWPVRGDVVLCSPPYGCSFGRGAASKHMLPHQLRARLERIGTYSAAWDRLLRGVRDGAYTSGSASAYLAHYGEAPEQIGHWRGRRYWTAMEQIYGNAHAALPPGGLMILVVKDHIRRGVWQATADETVALCARLGFGLLDRHRRALTTMSLWQRRRRERGETVVAHEDVLVLRKEEA